LPLTQILEEIRQLRQKVGRVVECREDLTRGEVLALSRKMDELVNLATRMGLSDDDGDGGE